MTVDTVVTKPKLVPFNCYPGANESDSEYPALINREDQDTDANHLQPNISYPSPDPQSTAIKLIHNYLLISPADAVLHHTQPGYQSLRHALRAAIFTSLITEIATYNTTYC